MRAGVRLGLAAAVGSALPIANVVVPHGRTAPQPAQWFKGNTHTHTTESDGDSTPEEVARWYRTHGYAFLVLSDHNVLTDVRSLDALNGRDSTFLLIAGEEVTDRFEDKPVHVNGLDIARRVEPQHGGSVVDVIQRNVDEIRRAKGVPHVNHPNFGWAISADEIRQVQNNRLFEIYNGHPHVNNVGGGRVPGLEEAWDAILSTGMVLYGIAVDDAHTFKDPGNPDVAAPGRGWIVVRAAALTAPAVLRALEAGDFYASTGVELADVVVSAHSLRVEIRERPWAKYRVQFVARGGRIVHEVPGTPAEYEFRGDEGYVRARVIESSGRMAWCQPVVVDPARR